MSTVYALMVGIDTYRAVSPLSGCRNDAVAALAYLSSRVGSRNLASLELHDDKATRAAIVDGLRHPRVSPVARTARSSSPTSRRQRLPPVAEIVRRTAPESAGRRSAKASSSAAPTNASRQGSGRSTTPSASCSRNGMISMNPVG